MLKIEDITKYTGSEYGVYRFQAKAIDTTGTYADSELSNIEIYNIPLLNLSLSGITITITGFIDGVTNIELYLDKNKIATLTRTTETSLTYTISDDVTTNELHSFYAVALGTGIKENYSNTVYYGVVPTFADNSWQTIAGISNQIAELSLTGDLLYNYIEQNYGWKVGDTKAVQLKNGDIFDLQIWDFNVYMNKKGKKSGIALGSVQLQRNSQVMDDTSTNVGGFGASKMATTTLPSYFELLPDDLQNVIQETNITYHSGVDDPTTEKSDYFKLFLASEYEIFKTTNYAKQEGVWLKYWQKHDNAESRKKHRIGQTSSGNYWLRSASRSSSSYFAIVFGDGNSSTIAANNSYGVCLCLSI